MSIKHATTLKISAITDVGRERNHNEDNFTINPNVASSDWTFDNTKIYEGKTAGTVLVVADGMGGMNAGEVASKLAVQGVEQYFNQIQNKQNLSQQEIKTHLQQAILQANQQIIQHSQEYPETAGMGTTIVVAWIIENQVFVSWIGDSRLYLFRPSTGLIELSKDHSLVQKWVNDRKLTREQAFFHPENNVVLQSLGDHQQRLDLEFEGHELIAGDRLLLCSDGLNGMLQDAEIEHILKAHQNINTCAKNLVHKANQAGGYDNTTVVLCDMVEVPVGAVVAMTDKSSKKLSVKAKPNSYKLILALLSLIIVGLVTALILLTDNPISNLLAIDNSVAIPIDSTQVKLEDTILSPVPPIVEDEENQQDDDKKEDQNDKDEDDDDDNDKPSIQVAKKETQEKQKYETSTNGTSSIKDETKNQLAKANKKLDARAKDLERLKDILEKMKKSGDNGLSIIGEKQKGLQDKIQNLLENPNDNICTELAEIIKMGEQLKYEHIDAAKQVLEATCPGIPTTVPTKPVQQDKRKLLDGLEKLNTVKPEEQTSEGDYSAKGEKAANGLTAVEKDGKWGYIDENEIVKVALKYDAAYIFHEDLAAVQQNKKWGLIDKNGKVITPIEYENIKYENKTFILTKNGQQSCKGLTITSPLKSCN